MEKRRHTLRLDGYVEYCIRPLLQGHDLKKVFKKNRTPRKLKKKLKKEGRWKLQEITDLSQITAKYAK